MRRGIEARHEAAVTPGLPRKRRYVVHLPILATDLTGAQHLARTLGSSLGFLPDVDPGGITVSREDEQDVHHQVFCDRRLTGGRRCPLRADHDGPCGDHAGPDEDHRADR